VLRAGAVVEGSRGQARPRHDALVPLWVRQVAAAAAGLPVTTVLCGLDDALRIDPPSRSEAVAILQGWVEAWQAAWTAPLPIACRTACAWLAAGDPDDDDAPRAAFEGTGARAPGDLARSAYLRRSVDGYDERVADGMRRWAPPLYGGLVAGARPVAAAGSPEA
jgi:exodeoxyribonuclease V gamma subunit